MKHIPRHVAFFVEQAPVGGANISCLCAHPTEVSPVAAIIPYQAMRLQLPNHLVCLWPVVVFLHVNLPRLVGTTIPAITAIGTIKPHLEYLAIVGEKLTELVAEIFHICRSGIRGMVAVPGREIDCKLQSFLAASLGQFLHHIALTVLPRRVLH